MDVKYIPADWEKMRSGLNSLIGKGYGKGMIDELKDISSNFEEAESDISIYDSDGVISFTHTDREKTYQGLLEDFDVLYRFTGKVGDIVDRTIDQPFYEDIDAFVSEIRDLSISNYKTKNRIGVTDLVYLPESYGGSIELAKQEVGLDDVFSGDSFYGKQMELEYEAWKDMNVDEDTKDITQEDYQMAALNTRAFGYESIRDTQENKEFWVNIGVLAVMIGATVLAVVVPVVGIPLALGLGALYGGTEAVSAISGKDLISRRELGTGERWFRGVLAPLDIIPGAAALKKFSGVAKVTSFAGDLGKLGKTTAQSSIRKVNDLSIAAGKEASIRLKNVGAVMKERAREVPSKLAEGAIGAAKGVDETITNTKKVLSNFMPAPEFAFSGGAVKESIENTHGTVNAVKYMVSKIEGLNIGGKGALQKIKGKFGFDSTSELKGFDKQISKELEKHKLSLEEFHDLRLKPVSALSNTQLSVMKGIRDAVPPITKDTLLQKTIPIKDVENYLSGEFSEIGGYVAKAEDVADIRKYDDVVESSRLDYTTWDGTRPYPEGGDSYAMIRFKTSKIDEIDIPYGEKLGGTNSDGPPCTLNGFTGARNGKVIPEFQFNDRYLPENGAELYQVFDGKEVLRGLFDSDLKVFVPVK